MVKKAKPEIQKRGPKPKGKVAIVWSPQLAYVVGLIVTDGSLSKDMRHINFVSTDLQLITLYKKLLKLKNVIGIKKHKEDKFLYPCTDVHKEDIPEILDKYKINYTKAILYRTVCSDLSDLAEVTYDISEVYKHVACDGVAYKRKHDGSVIGPVPDLEMAAVFEIGRLMHKHRVMFWNS